MTAFLLLALAAAPAADPTPAATLNLWPATAPGETKELPPEAYQPSKAGQSSVKRLGNVSVPQIAVYMPAKEIATGACVVVAPGGGYSILAIEHEGTDVATWLNSIGVAAVVLKYRVPYREMQTPANLAQLQDAQRAVGLVRGKAAEWNLDAKRVGFLGFSAGGHLTASLCTHSAKRLYDRIDAADDLSCRPDFASLIYPGGITDKAGAIKPELTPTKDFPPAFFVHASDDNADQTLAIYRGLKAVNVPAELHLYATGGHGFGMRTGDSPTAAWPKRFGEWMKTRGLLAPAGK